MKEVLNGISFCKINKNKTNKKTCACHGCVYSYRGSMRTDGEGGDSYCAVHIGQRGVSE